jgi:outer membrane lipoprotein SlyB
MNSLLIRRAASLVLLAGTFTLAGCVSPGGHAGYGNNYRAAHAQACRDCGRITDIVEFHGDGRATGGGAVAGAIIGGLAGNQVGGGSGRRAATVAGVVAGGLVGHRVEENVRSAPTYDIHITLDNGRRVVEQQRQIGGLRIGSYVRVSGGQVRAL